MAIPKAATTTTLRQYTTTAVRMLSLICGGNLGGLRRKQSGLDKSGLVHSGAVTKNESPPRAFLIRDFLFPVDGKKSFGGDLQHVAGDGDRLPGAINI